MSGSQGYGQAAEIALSQADPERAAILRRRRMADALMRESQSPEIIRSNSQGLARLAQAALGAWQGYSADRADQALQTGRQEDASNFSAGLLGLNAPQKPQEAPQAPAEAAPAAPGPAVPYGRNAGLVAGRDALLDAPPEQLAAASASRSAASGIPEIPNGYRANGGLEGVFNGAAPPSGVVNASLSGPAATMPGPTVTAPAPAPMDNNRMMAALLKGSQSPNPMIRQMVQTQMPIVQASLNRDENNRFRTEDREDRQRFQEQQMRLQRELAGANRAPEPLVPVMRADGSGGELVPRSQAAGRSPYIGDRATEPLVPVAGEGGRGELVPRSQAAGREPYNASTSGSGNLTESQSKANMFGNAMTEGDRVINSLQAPNSGTILAWRNAPESLVNMVLSPNDQRYFNGLRQFAAGVLRKETGAAFSSSELLDVQSRFFPMPGDDAATQAQKARAREQAIASMRAEIPGGFRGQMAPPQAAPAQNGQRPPLSSFGG